MENDNVEPYEGHVTVEVLVLAILTEVEALKHSKTEHETETRWARIAMYRAQLRLIERDEHE